MAETKRIWQVEIEWTEVNLNKWIKLNVVIFRAWILTSQIFEAERCIEGKDIQQKSLENFGEDKDRYYIVGLRSPTEVSFRVKNGFEKWSQTEQTNFHVWNLEYFNPILFKIHNGTSRCCVFIQSSGLVPGWPWFLFSFCILLILIFFFSSFEKNISLEFLLENMLEILYFYVPWTFFFLTFIYCLSAMY